MLLELIITVLVLSAVAYLLWVVTEQIQHATFKSVIRVLVYLLLIVYVLRRYGSILNL